MNDRRIGSFGWSEVVPSTKRRCTAMTSNGRCRIFATGAAPFGLCWQHIEISEHQAIRVRSWGGEAQVYAGMVS